MSEAEKIVVIDGKSYREKSVTHVVKPTYCLWFAWAPAADLEGPGDPYNPNEPKEQLRADGSDEFRPIAVPFDPNTVFQITLEVVRSIEWAHDPANSFSGPEGRNIAPVEAHSNYQSSTYNSQNILKLSAKFNTLVCMLGSGPNLPGRQFEVGAGPKTLQAEIEGTDSHLFLGFHDNYEWNNNVKRDPNGPDMEVRITTLSFTDEDQDDSEE